MQKTTLAPVKGLQRMPAVLAAEVIDFWIAFRVRNCLMGLSGLPLPCQDLTSPRSGGCNLIVPGSARRSVHKTTQHTDTDNEVVAHKRPPICT